MCERVKIETRNQLCASAKNQVIEPKIRPYELNVKEINEGTTMRAISIC